MRPFMNPDRIHGNPYGVVMGVDIVNYERALA